MRRKAVLLAVSALIAAIGVSLVLVYVNSASGTATAQQSLVKVLTATSLVNVGETATIAQSEGKFALTEVPASSVVAGAITSTEAMGVQVALAPIYPGEQILSQMFGTTAQSQQTLPVPRGQLAVSVQLTDPGRVAGFLTAGSRVAIFVSVTDTLPYTRILVPAAEVIAVGPSTVLTVTGSTSGSQSDPVSNTVLTVALNQHDADLVQYASNNAVLSFGLLGPGTTITPDRGVTGSDLPLK